jgi:ubiquinone/menaquinone biosynthesis C-methylase UbiE
MTNSIITPELLSKYADHTLEGRHRIALAWIDTPTDRLLDAGCSYGYATRFYATKAKKVIGIELDEQLVAIGRAKYANVEFLRSTVDHTPFPDAMFDCIVMTDVLEHVPDRILALNELYRILKPGGIAIITTPHKGLFSLFDPYNYGYYLKRYLRPVYKILFKIVRFIKEGSVPTQDNPVHSEKHYHFSKKDFLAMLDTSEFSGHYKIERWLRSGLFIEATLLNLEVLLGVVIKNPRMLRKILKPLAWLADKDYSINYHILSFNIGLKLRKLS